MFECRFEVRTVRDAVHAAEKVGTYQTLVEAKAEALSQASHRGEDIEIFEVRKVYSTVSEGA